MIFYITQVPCKKCGQVSGCRETMGRTALHNLVSGAGADGNDGNDYFIIETYDENKRAKKMYIFPHNLFLFLSFLSFSSENTQWNGSKT